MPSTPQAAPCQSRPALAAWNARAAAEERARRLEDEVCGGLRHFTDSFMDAIGGDFLAEADERRLRDQYRNEPRLLARKLAGQRRTLLAQRALHALYAKLLDGAPLSPEEQALAEHARDLADAHAAREIGRHASGL